MRSSTRSTLAGGALVLLALAAYANSFTAGLVLDNNVIIGEDPRLRAVTWENLRAIFTENYWWPSFITDLYRPLPTLSFLFNYSVLGNGASPPGYHVVNFLLHAANVLLVWRIALRLGATAALAWIAAALFAIHPLGVEVVTNIVGRLDLVTTFNVLAAVGCWLRQESATGRRVLAWRAGMGLFALAAVFSKENGVMVIPLLALLTVWRSGWRTGTTTLLRQTLPALLPAAAAALTIRWVFSYTAPPLPQVFVGNPIAHLAAGPGALTAFKVIGKYLVLLVWPRSLACDYSYPQIPLYGAGGWEDFQAWLAVLAVIALGVGAWRVRGRWPLASLGLAWGGLVFLPTSNLLLPMGSIMGERFLYLPMTGLVFVGATLLDELRQRFATPARPWLGWLIPVICLAALGGRTFARNRDWSSDTTLWRAALTVSPRSFNVYKGLATARVAEDKSETAYDEAIAIAEKGLPLLDDPPLPPARQNNSLWLDLASYHANKARLRELAGDEQGARASAVKSLAMIERAFATERWICAEVQRRYAARGDTAAAQREHGNAKVHQIHALVLFHLDRQAEAREAVALWRRFVPLEPDALRLLGLSARMTGHHEQAAVRFLQLVIAQPANLAAWAELEACYRALGVNPLPVTRLPQGGKIETADPMMRTHLNTALQDIVLAFQAAGDPAGAQSWRERAIRDYGCAPELFATPPR